jgi:hypothetical protein
MLYLYLAIVLLLAYAHDANAAAGCASRHPPGLILHPYYLLPGWKPTFSMEIPMFRTDKIRLNLTVCIEYYNKGAYCTAGLVAFAFIAKV